MGGDKEEVKSDDDAMPIVLSGSISESDISDSGSSDDDTVNENDNDNNSVIKPSPKPAPSPYRGIYLNVIQFHKDYFNSCIASILSNIDVKKYSFQVQAAVAPPIFAAIFHCRRFIAHNGDHVVFVGNGDGGVTTKRDPGFYPVPCLWYAINSGTQVIGFSDNYFSRVHTVNLVRSPNTFVSTLFLDVEHRHAHSRLWVHIKAPRKQQQ